ncbi:60S ribosomal subunit assembly/export protein [Knufia obscura]|uniref:60S ribosomal subunit assembly/export protein n=2 Tax=Knufia TaxID=430999 RepID=A0AAN8I496_9EURO|nr:60S ribosomal subunit assembly/export protein [Knufia obscura]KAK5951364.1 60S ribosomal subunit assembly/export protein [Knufia fluminis]
MAAVKSAKSTPGKRMARKSATSGPSKSSRKPTGKLPSSLTKQIKTKPGSQASKPKKKKTTYTEKQLDLPVLNSIIPANAKTVQKAGGTGKKKGKVFVDDMESMVTILAMVNAEKDGQIESKVAKERQMEEIREARRKEAEKKEVKRQGRIEKVKGEIKSGERRGKKGGVGRQEVKEKEKEKEAPRGKSRDGKGKRKSVSFA